MSGTLILVPQQPYQSLTHFTPQPAIQFTTRGRPGVNIQDARMGNLSDLDDPDTALIVSNTSTRITLRILVSRICHVMVGNSHD